MDEDGIWGGGEKEGEDGTVDREVGRNIEERDMGVGRRIEEEHGR